jgi:hypothetical protein
MIASTRRSLLLVALALIGATLALGAAQSAHAASYKSCTLSERDQDPAGDKPTYNLALKQIGTTCPTAKKVMNAFQKCRTTTNHRCTRKLLSSRWSCTSKKDSSTSTLFYATFTCSWGKRRVRSTFQQNTPSAAGAAVRAAAAPRPRCFGAAARDRVRPCSNPTKTVVPSVAGREERGDPPCTPQEVRQPGVSSCAFGVPAARATEHIALVGDSHALHWDAAMKVVARANRWHGSRLTMSTCFLTAAVESFLPDAREGCTDWYRGVLAWFGDHPEVSTVFVSQKAGAQVVLGPGQTRLGLLSAGFRRAWAALPKTVKHVVVIRDVPTSTNHTFDCVRDVAAAGKERPGPACLLPRSTALKPDPAVSAARLLRSPRYQSVDLTEFFCTRRTCSLVVGGVLVNSDLDHITQKYSLTLGPYLLRKLRRLMTSW